MDYSVLTVSIGLFLAVVSFTSGQEVSHVPGFKEVESLYSNNIHQPQKRSTLINPVDDQVHVLQNDDDQTNSLFSEDDPEKRSSLFRFGKRQGSLFRFGKRQGSLFRFGKRQGSLFRFGKRGSLLRFGKRQGSLFRFGKRGGSLFRFGRSGIPYDNTEEEKRTLFRFGKRSDLDLSPNYLGEYENIDSPSYLEDVEGKRGLDNFQWGEDYVDQ